MPAIEELTEVEAQEFSADFTSSRVDKAAGLIKGVKILGAKSTNGRQYTESAMRSGAPLYEGVPVYVDHSSDLREGRSYRDRFGALQQIRYEGGGLYGDLKFNPRHAVAEQFMWDVENSTPKVGFSHTVMNRVRVVKGKEIVEQIAKVLSVDLVSNPATTSTVFEQTKEPEPMAEEQTTEQVFSINELTPSQIKAERPGLYEQIGEQWAEANIAKLEVEADRHLRGRVEILVKENDELRREIADSREAQESIQRRIEVDHKILQAGLPRDIDDKLFREQLYEAADLHGMDRVDTLIQHWRSAVGRHRPVSREQGGYSHRPVLDGKSFAQSVQR